MRLTLSAAYASNQKSYVGVFSRPNLTARIAPIKIPTINIAKPMSKSRESGKVPEVVWGEGEADVPLCVGRTTRYPFICLDADVQLELQANSNTPAVLAYKLEGGIYVSDGSE